MVKIVIVDDENNVRIVIKKMLNLLFTDCEIVGECASVKEALDVIPETKPDIVLLDIELEDGNGFSLLKQLPVLDFKLIFITAFNEYAIKAFKVNALDYILKPIEPSELKSAINKAKEMLTSEKELKKQLENINSEKIDKIVIKTTENTHFITIDDIKYCKADGSYSYIYTTNKTILTSKNLKHFEEILPAQKFIRTHQSYLVNKSEIVSIKSNTILLKNNIEVPVSVRKKAKISALLNL